MSRSSLHPFTFTMTRPGESGRFTFYGANLDAARRLAESWAKRHGWVLEEADE